VPREWRRTAGEPVFESNGSKSQEARIESFRVADVSRSIDYLRLLVENPRAWRLTLLAVIVIPILVVLPHARSLIIRNAVVTAHLSHLKAPISGDIEVINAVAGSVSEESVPLLSIVNPKVDGSRVARLEVLRHSAEREVQQLRAQLELVRAVAATRNAEYESNVSSVTQDLNSQLQTVTDRANARSAALREAEGNLERVRSLFKSELLSPSDVEAAEAAYENAKAEYSANALEQKRLTERMDEIRSGVFQVDIPEGVLMTRQAAQELNLEVLGLERALETAEANLEATNAETESARVSYQERAATEVRLPTGKTIWRVHASTGTWTTEGTHLLSFVDCSALMVDIAMDDATLELIEPGSEVHVRMFGSFKHRTARVILVRGSAGLASDPSVLAAEVENRGSRKGRVLARLDPSEMSEMPSAFCGIGRTAYAEFEDLNLFEILILPLFR